jgi:hypothetical protein
MTREKIAKVRLYFGVSPMVAGCIVFLAGSPGRFRCALEMLDAARDALALERDIDPRLAWGVHIHAARRALAQAGFPRAIRNMYGFGFAMEKAAARRVQQVLDRPLEDAA